MSETKTEAAAEWKEHTKEQDTHTGTTPANPAAAVSVDAEPLSTAIKLPSPIAADLAAAAASTAESSLTSMPPATAPAAPPATASSLQNVAPELIDPSVNDDIPPLDDPALDELRDEIYSLIRSIHDPEHPHSLEQLGVVYKSGLTVDKQPSGLDGKMHEIVEVEFKPTVPHCSLATLIGLCIRTKVAQSIPQLKFGIRVKEDSHQTAAEISKQLNDKERAAAAMENPALRETVERLIKDVRAYE